MFPWMRQLHHAGSPSYAVMADRDFPPLVRQPVEWLVGTDGAALHRQELLPKLTTSDPWPRPIRMSRAARTNDLCREFWKNDDSALPGPKDCNSQLPLLARPSIQRDKCVTREPVVESLLGMKRITHQARPVQSLNTEPGAFFTLRGRLCHRRNHLSHVSHLMTVGWEAIAAQTRPKTSTGTH